MGGRTAGIGISIYPSGERGLVYVDCVDLGPEKMTRDAVLRTLRSAIDVVEGGAGVFRGEDPADPGQHA